MATSIGVVSQVVGEVFAVAGDGTRRPVVEGDRVFAGEQLVTGAIGAVAVSLENGQQLTLGRDSSVNLTVQMLAQAPDASAPGQEAPPVAPSADDLTDVEQLQAAIEAGVDPTLEGEATAAGPGAGGGAGGVGGGHSFVLLDAVGGAVDPVIGFPTAGLATAVDFPDPDPIFTDDPLPAALETDVFPSAGEAANAVDEDGLSDGIAGGNNDAAGEDVLVLGTLGYDFGPGGVGEFAWNPAGLDALGVSSAGVPLTYSLSDDSLTLTASAGDIPVFILTLTELEAGTYAFILLAPIDHAAPPPGGSDENDLTYLFSYTITDGGGSSASGSLTITIDDDSPELAGVIGDRPTVYDVVHEDALGTGNAEDDADPAQTTTVSGDASVLGALVSFGADGPGTFSLNGSDEALQSLNDLGLTSADTALFYSVSDDGTLLTATAGEGGDPVFTLLVNADGSYEFTLEGQIDHPLDDGIDSELLGDNSIALDFSALLVATDYDGDAVVGGFDLGSFVIDIEDDVPVQSGAPGDRSVVQGLVHEDALDTGNGEDDADPVQTTSVIGDVGALDALVSFGADGRGGFQLSTDPGALGDLQALLLTSGGTDLFYSVSDDGTLLTATAGEGGEPVFSLQVNTDGSYEFTLEGKIDHPLDDGIDSELLGDSSIALDFSSVLLATDGDGDPLADAFEAGSFIIDIEDDVPVQSGAPGDRPVVQGLVHEDALDTGNGEDDADPVQTTSVIGEVGALDALVSFGADGRGGFQLSTDPGALGDLQALLLTSGGTELFYSVSDDGSTLIATAGEFGTPVFSLQVNADGSYAFTLSGPLDHPLDNGDDGETLGASGLAIDFSSLLLATDGDGDPLADAFEAGSFIIDVEDDVPEARDEHVKKALDDEGLDGGISGGAGDVPGMATTVGGTLEFSAGADGLRSVELSGPDMLGSEAVSSVWDPDSNTLTISSDRGDLLTVQVNPLTGAYVVSLLQPLLHEEGGNENNILLDIDYTVTDGDGDTDSASLCVTIDDDIPTISQSDVSDTSQVVFNGSDAGFANSYGYYIKNPDGSPQSGKVIWANVHDQEPGDSASLDGLNPEEVGFFIIPNGGDNDDLGNGDEVTFEFDGSQWHALLDGVPLVGADGANVLFSDATLNPGGAHLQDTSDPGNQNWEDQTNSSDFDYNDVSTSVTWGGQLQVDESDFDTDATRDFSGVFTVQPGADGLRSLTYELTLAEAEPDAVGLDSGLVDTQSGEPVYLTQVDASTVEGRTAGGELVFTVSVDENGVVTLDQDRAIMHPTSDPDEPKVLGADLIGLNATVTDNDGDSASSVLDLGALISFKDDGPLAIDDVAPTVFEGGSEPNVTQGNVLDNDQAGNDGGKAFVGWNTPANAAAVAELAKYGTLVLDPDTGAYSFTLDNDDPDTQALANGETVSQSLHYTMQDADGDISTAVLTINIVGTNSVVTIGGLEVDGGEVIVDEQHLATGSAPDAAELSQSGSFSISAADGIDTIRIGDSPEFTFAQLQGASVGTPLVIDSPAGVLTITGFVGDSSGGTVSYTYALENASEHPDGAGENSLAEQFEVVVTDLDGDSASATLDVTIIDDVPEAKDNKVCIEGSGLPPFNLTLILDSSASMDDRVWADLDGDGSKEETTRLDVAKAALANLIDSYIALGVPLNFKVIDFDNTARLVYEGTDPTEAKAAIDAMTEGGNTHYDNALELARDELEDDLANPDLDGYENRLYFLSDGEPYPHGNEAPDDWQEFVDDNGIDVVAVGIQIPSGGEAEDELGEVANAGDDVIVVDDPDELSATLADTVPDAVEGNVLTDAGPDGVDVAGADGPISVIAVSYVDVDGVLQTVTVPEGGSTGPLQTELGGTLVMSSDGSYSYVAPDDTNGDVEDVFTYTIEDADGDTSSANLTLCIKDSVPQAKDNAECVPESGLPPFNLTLILDSSASMDDTVQADLDGNGTKENTTRLDVAKAALANLIDSYIALGVPLNFKVIDFDNTARLVYEGTDPAEAKAAIDAMTEGGNTHYDNALELARDELEDDLANPDLDGYENRLYFLSDGEPYPRGNEAPDDWQEFVDDNGIDVIAVGIQIPSGGEAEDELGEVANAGDDVIVVDDPDELSATLAGTVPSGLEGNVITDVGPDGVDDPGADGPVSVILVTYTNAAGEVVEVAVPDGGSTGPLQTLLGGTLVMSSDGSYSYVAPTSAPEGAEDVFSYTIADSDGDPSTANLTICIEDGAPIANDDTGKAEEGYWKAHGEVSYSTEYALTDGAKLSTRDIDVDSISNADNQGQKSSSSEVFHVAANNGAPATVSFGVKTDDWDHDDRWQAELFKVGEDVAVDQLLNQTGNLNDVTFDSITESGDYYVKFTVFDNSGGTTFPLNLFGRADLTIKDLQYSTSLQQFNLSVPALSWVAALAASGNVLGNDNPGPDGGLQVTHVDGQLVPPTGLTLDGLYGTLHIDSDGNYLYTPADEDLPSGSSDSFTYSIVDADGSTDSAVLTVGIKDRNYDDDASNKDDFIGGNEGHNTLDGRKGDDVVYGGGGNDTLKGGEGSDHLIGGSGDDTLYGESGNDVLNGGAGNDSLFGGSGNDWLIGGEGEDIFIWNSGESGTDVIADFQAGANGDALDLSALLVGENAGNLEEFLTFSFGPSTTIMADSNGAASGGNTQTIVLDGVDLGSVYGSTNAGEVITAMLDDGSLVANA